MSPSASIKLSTGLLLLLSAVSSSVAKPPSEAPWVTETVRASFWPVSKQGSSPAVDPFGSGYIPSADPPRLPDKMDSAKRWEESVEICTRWNAEALEELGVPLPPGTFFLWDVITSTLAVHTRSSAMPEIRRLARRSLSLKKQPEIISVHATVLEGRQDVVLPMLEETYTSSDHRTMFNRLKRLVAEGQVRPVNEFRLEARPGQRATAKSGVGTRETLSGQWNAATLQQHITEEYLSGFDFELEASKGLNPEQMDVTFVLKHANKPPTRRQEMLGGPGGIAVEVPLADQHISHVECTTQLVSGTPRILAAWTPHHEERPENQDSIRLLLVEANLLPVLPPETPFLKERLAQHAEPLKSQSAKPATTSTQKSVAKSLPPGMEFRYITVPAAFLADHPQEQIKKADIPMPAGSECVFHSATCTLHVVNTSENLDAIQALANSPQFRGRPVLRHTLHILHGDGPTLRKWSKEMTHAADPVSKWQELLELTSTQPEQVKLLELVRTEVQSEKRISIFNAAEHMIVVPADKPNDTETVQEPSKQESAKVDKGAAQSFEIQYRHVGMVVQADSVADSEGRIIDCNLALEYDYAPPTFVPEGQSEGQAQFHRANLVTPLTMQSGIPQVVGEWIPLNFPGTSGKDVLQIAVLRIDPIWIPESGE